MILALLIAKEIAFSGKNVHNLADALSAIADKPVAILRGETPEIPPFTIQPSEDVLFRQLFKVRSGYTCGLSWAGYFEQALPDYMIRRTYRTGVDGDAKWVDSDPVRVEALRDKKFRIRPGKEGGSLVSELVATIPGKWSVHWRYESAVVAFSTGPMTLSEFATSLTEALGAKMTSTGERISLSFNPLTYKQRFVAWLDKQIKVERRKNPNSYQCINLQFAREAIIGAPINAFNAAFEKPDAHGEYQISKDSVLEKWAVRRIQAWVTRTDVANAGPETRASFVGQIDWDRPVSVWISGSNSNVAIQAYKKGEPNHKIVF